MGFDDVALTYDRQLGRGLRLAGEGPEYFARRRAEVVAGHLRRQGRTVASIVEFGCGTGNQVAALRRSFAGARLAGLDISRRSLEVARRRHGGAEVVFLTPEEFQAPAGADLVFANGVFHHIPPAEHARWIRYLVDLLRPGGRLAIFENNPWSPAARLVMRLIPFDRDAVMVRPGRLAAGLREAGLEIMAREFWFVFPRVLGFLRSLEPPLRRFPVGAQYLLLAGRP